MVREQGLSGLIGLHTARFAIDGWEIHHQSQSVLVYCDGENFMDRYGLESTTLAEVLGHDWQIRCDNEDHIYYGIGKCRGLSKPAARFAVPRREFCPHDLVLHFEFLYGSYGPYHMAEAIAMGRNGNCMFFDLMPLLEVESRIAQRDVRFLYNQPN
jgi:hypothetical protein